MVCKHACKLGKVLTAATPRLEQRFDADLKEDRILQAQHGGSPKLGFTPRHKFYRVPVTFISKNSNIPLFLKKVYTSHICGSSPLTRADYYPPQVLVKRIIPNDIVSSD